MKQDELDKALTSVPTGAALDKDGRKLFADSRRYVDRDNGNRRVLADDIDKFLRDFERRFGAPKETRKK